MCNRVGDLQEAIEDACEIGARAFPNGSGFSVSIWTSGRAKWHAALAFAGQDGIEETQESTEIGALEAVEALVGWLDDRASDRAAE